MKQNISVEQLQELSEEQKIKLSALYKPTDEFSIIKTDWYLGLPLLSIGQMIEILEKEYDIIIEKENFWKIKMFAIHKMGTYEFIEDNLCDALWLAVKNIL